MSIFSSLTLDEEAVCSARELEYLLMGNEGTKAEKRGNTGHASGVEAGMFVRKYGGYLDGFVCIISRY